MNKSYQSGLVLWSPYNLYGIYEHKLIWFLLVDYYNVGHVAIATYDQHKTRTYEHVMFNTYHIITETYELHMRKHIYNVNDVSIETLPTRVV